MYCLVQGVGPIWHGMKYIVKVKYSRAQRNSYQMVHEKVLLGWFVSKGPVRRSEGKMRQYNFCAPFEGIAMDVAMAGPFPKNNKCNKYVLVVIDYFSKCNEVNVIPNQEVKTCAEVLIKTR